MAYCFTRARVAAALLLSTALAACSTDVLVPPGQIDGATRVGAISPTQQTRRAVSRPVEMAPSAQSYALAAPESPALTIPEGGVDMDAGLGVGGENSGPRVVGLAEEQAGDIAEAHTSQPVVDGIGTDAPVLVRPRSLSASTAPPQWQSQAPAMPSAPYSIPADVATRQVAMVRPDSPVMRDAPPMSAMPEAMPASEQSCRAELRRMGVSFRDIPRIDGGATCGVAYPMKVSGLPGGVAVNETTLNCQVTLAFARWVKDEVTPSARARYFSGVAKIETMGGYSCRRMNSRANNPWSEHARGNAVDIGTIVLKNGKEIDVRKKGFFAFREKGLLKSVRSDSCKYFSTVLGPGSDADHWNHFHLDLRAHKGGYRHCD